MWKTGDPEIATPERVRTYRPKQSDTSLSREWRINMPNKKKIYFIEKKNNCFFLPMNANSKGWFSLGVDCRRSVKKVLFLYLVLYAQRER